MKLTRRKLIKSALLVGSTLGVKFSAIAADTNTYVMYEPYDSLSSLKKAIPWASKWWEFKLHDKIFVVCLEDFPSYGQSRKSVHAWRQNKEAQFVLAWSLRTLGIGPLEVIVDETKGIVSVKAIAQTDLKDSIVGFVQLAATAG